MIKSYPAEKTSCLLLHCFLLFPAIIAFFKFYICSNNQTTTAIKKLSLFDPLIIMELRSGEVSAIWKEIEESINEADNIIQDNAAEARIAKWGKTWEGQRVNDALTRIKARMVEHLQQIKSLYKVRKYHFLQDLANFFSFITSMLGTSQIMRESSIRRMQSSFCREVSPRSYQSLSQLYRIRSRKANIHFSKLQPSKLIMRILKKGWRWKERD